MTPSMHRITVERNGIVESDFQYSSRVGAYRALLAWLRRERLLQNTHVWTLNQLEAAQAQDAKHNPLLFGWIEGGGAQFFYQEQAQ